MDIVEDTLPTPTVTEVGTISKNTSRFELEALIIQEDPTIPPPPKISFLRLLLVILGLFVSVLLVTLDHTIVATALPQIVSSFSALQDATWIVTAYYLTQGGCMLTVGQILRLSSKKTVFLVSIAIFEIGSLISALSPSMPVLILGRAISGCGAAGIQITVAVINNDIIPLDKRPIYFASFGAIIGISTVAGPLLGGVLTDKVSWRWCFWINLPCGGLAGVLVFVFLRINSATSTARKESSRSLLSLWLRLDWIGAILVLGVFTCLLLAPQWGGNLKPWNSPTVISLFVLTPILLALVVFWEKRKGDEALIPPAVYSRRTSIGCSMSGFMGYVMMLIATFFLPLWYQSLGSSATHSGLRILPILITLIIAAGVSGGIVTKTGNYWWFLLLSPLVTCIAAGLLFTIDSTTTTARIIGYQILWGIGVGCIFQNVLVAIQAEFEDDEELVPQASSLVFFFQNLGGIVGVAMAGSIFANRLHSNLKTYAPGLPDAAESAVIQSVTAIKDLPASFRPGVIEAYSKSLAPVFLSALPAGILASLSALLITNYNLKVRGAMKTTT